MSEMRRRTGEENDQQPLCRGKRLGRIVRVGFRREVFLSRMMIAAVGCIEYSMFHDTIAT